MTIYIGLGSAAKAERLSLRWPSGQVDEIESLEAGRWYVVKEGVGVLNPSAARAKRVAERERWGWGPTALIGVLR
jgi:hypothetical protein